MSRRRHPVQARDASRDVRDRAAFFLEAQDGPVSSSVLAREVLGLRHGSESACGAILEPVLEGDARFARTAEGRWILGEPAAHVPDAREPALRERSWSVWAVESDRRAAACLRVETGRIVAERVEPSEEHGIAAPVAALGEPAWRRLCALASHTLVTSWDGTSLVEDALAHGAEASPYDAAEAHAYGSLQPDPYEGFIPLSTLARAALGAPRPRTLERLAASLGVGYVEAETPLSRARLAAECLLRLLEREPIRDLGEEGLRALLEVHALPHPGLDDPEGPLRRSLEGLPSEPGVYRFFDAEDHLLYVGKARDLRRRVGSYFAARARPDARTAPWLGSVARIEHDCSGSELEALLREASQIAERAPAKNRQRAVHARRGRRIGDLVLVQSAERAGAVRVALVKDGALAARILLGPRGGGRERLRTSIEEIYFTSQPPRVPRPGSRQARREAASRGLLLSWLRRQPAGVPPLDPTDDPGPDEACARVLAAATALRRGEIDVTFLPGSTSKKR